MHVYRYRNSNLLSQKALLYDEWYFASKEELNDPIDMQSNFEFSQSGWSYLLNNLWNNSAYAAIAADHLSEISPISHEKLLDSFDTIKQNIIHKTFKSKSVQLSEVISLQQALTNLYDLISLYGPGSGYSVSLSRTSASMLMWSHYANSHTGFCLIYRPINGKLSQCPSRKKDAIEVSRGHSTCVPTDFDIENIIYDDQISSLDATSLLPVIYTTNRLDSDDTRAEWHKNKKAQLLTKNKCWEYEEECRLMLPQTSKWISGNSSYSALQRLFYYDFDQVVGVVFGARMTATHKDALRDIITLKLDKKYKSAGGERPRFMFDFLYQQAEICPTSRSMNIKDLDLHFMGRTINPSDAIYNDRLIKWRNGEGIKMCKGTFSYEPIP